MRAHQPGSTPIDIPETVPNPAYTPAPAPERAPTKVPEKVPEKVISGIADATADDIARLKNMAQKHPSVEIAPQLGRSTGATIVQAHKMKLSLRLRRPKDEE